MDEAFEAVTGNSIWALAVAGIAGVAIIGGRRAKPLARTAIKGYLGGRAWARERFAEATERVQDLYAEAKYEYQSELAKETEGGATAPKRGRRGSNSASEATASA
jgi:hypothetical protein